MRITQSIFVFPVKIKRTSETFIDAQTSNLLKIPLYQNGCHTSENAHKKRITKISYDFFFIYQTRYHQLLNYTKGI